MTHAEGLGRALVFVRGVDSGPVLDAEGQFLEEVRMAGWDIGDHQVIRPPGRGLLILEGWVQVGPGEDPDVTWTGKWRALTHWEMCRVRSGLSPFAELDKPEEKP